MGNLCGRPKEEPTAPAQQIAHQPVGEQTSLLLSQKQPIKSNTDDEQLRKECKEQERKRQQEIEEQERLAEQKRLEEEARLIEEEDQRLRAEEAERLRLQEEEMLREQHEVEHDPQIMIQEQGVHLDSIQNENVRASVQLRKELELMRLQEELDAQQQREMDERKRKRDLLLAQMNGAVVSEQPEVGEEQLYVEGVPEYVEQIDQQHHEQTGENTFIETNGTYDNIGTDIPPPPALSVSPTSNIQKSRPMRQQSEVVTKPNSLQKTNMHQSAPTLGLSAAQVEETRRALRPSVMRNKEEDVWKNVFK